MCIERAEERFAQSRPLGVSAKEEDFDDGSKKIPQTTSIREDTTGRWSHRFEGPKRTLGSTLGNALPFPRACEVPGIVAGSKEYLYGDDAGDAAEGIVTAIEPDRRD